MPCLFYSELPSHWITSIVDHQKYLIDDFRNSKKQCWVLECWTIYLNNILNTSLRWVITVWFYPCLSEISATYWFSEGERIKNLTKINFPSPIVVCSSKDPSQKKRAFYLYCHGNQPLIDVSPYNYHKKYFLLHFRFPSNFFSFKGFTAWFDFKMLLSNVFRYLRTSGENENVQVINLFVSFRKKTFCGYFSARVEIFHSGLWSFKIPMNKGLPFNLFYSSMTHDIMEGLDLMEVERKITFFRVIYLSKSCFIIFLGSYYFFVLCSWSGSTYA